MNPVHLYLVRHGETEWNVEARFQGHLDSKLTPRGEEQARAAGRRLAGTAFDHVYVSSSGRTRRTLELMLTQWPERPPVTMTDDLREIRHGAWQGKVAREVQALTPELYACYRTEPHRFPGAPGGESLHDVRSRVFGFLDRVVDCHAPGSTLLLVTHGVTTKVILTTIMERPLQFFWEPPFIESGSVCRVDADVNGFRITSPPAVPD
ncbi:MAG: histidine phosphatase family protein [Clostridia bacterium]